MKFVDLINNIEEYHIIKSEENIQKFRLKKVKNLDWKNIDEIRNYLIVKLNWNE